MKPDLHKALKRLDRALRNLVLLSIVLVAFFIYSFSNRPEAEEQLVCGGVVEPEWYCGNVNGADDRVFKANCASCHKYSKKLIGPALEGLPDRVPSRQWVFDFLTQQDSLMEADAYAKAVNVEYQDASQGFRHNFQYLTPEELEEIVNFVYPYWH